MTGQRISKAHTRGWCPGALRPMESGDGLIVRVRPHCGQLSFAQAKGIAECAIAYGNGYIDFTRRANIQIRGVSDLSIEPLIAKLSTLQLIDDNPQIEAVRNVIVSPLSGCDPTELIDMRCIAQDIERELRTNSALWQLPGKFGFILDGGGLLSLEDERTDIYLKAASGGIAIGLDRTTGPHWIAVVKPEAASVLAVRVALIYLNSRERRRMRDLPDNALHKIIQALDPNAGPLPSIARLNSCDCPKQGIIDHQNHPIAVGFAAPFGRLQAQPFLAFLTTSKPSDIHMSPWRTFYIAVSDPSIAAAIRSAGEANGLITDASDTRLRIDACPGAPACKFATFDTRKTAQLLAKSSVMNQYDTAHVSGCPKGCARSKPADFVLVGSEKNLNVILRGLANDDPQEVIPIDNLHDFIRSIGNREKVQAHA